MAKQITRWSPDTCSCVVEYEWDDSESEDVRTHTINKIVEQCLFHKELDVPKMHTTLFDENTRKNKLIGSLLTQFPALATVDDKGNTVLKPGILTWSFDDKRVLTVSVPMLDVNQKSDAQSWADANLGEGNVQFM